MNSQKKSPKTWINYSIAWTLSLTLLNAISSNCSFHMLIVQLNFVNQRRIFLVYGIFLIRNSFLKLGNRLNLERILNHPDIVFHLTHMELKNLVKNNTTGLLSRARRRQRLYEQQLKKRYAPLSIGVPTILIDDTSDTKRKVNLRLSGTTVCEGQVSGRARVVRTLFEAKDTEPGEVLITTWTDIAWSPLFPTISGLVTEIGDMVLLNTFKGTIERLNDEATDKQNDEC
ncbi:hypothetical protein M3Y98_00176900 [Aphelenchoides besseyi]|nr:hypothetical protein M3Y98_00176900 [Aphelenchoides besseyi]